MIWIVGDSFSRTLLCGARFCFHWMPIVKAVYSGCPLELQPSAGYGLQVSRCFLITHNDAPQSVGLLWASDQLVAETSTWQHTTDKHPVAYTVVVNKGNEACMLSHSSKYRSHSISSYTTFRSFHFCCKPGTFYFLLCEPNKKSIEQMGVAWPASSPNADLRSISIFFVEKMCEERWNRRLEGCDLVREGFSFLSGVRRGRLVVIYRHFGATYRYQSQWSIGLAAWPLKSGPMECPETALTYY
jgi:hypothetical protein